MSVSHKKAPVSEVIIGFNFSYSLFSAADIFRLQNKLVDDYPTIEFGAPLPDTKMDDPLFGMEFILNKSGNILFRLRSNDRKWLIQIQSNKIYLNWIRPDGEEPGHYPGFSSVYEKFKQILTAATEIKGEECFKNIKYYDLTYQDRIPWKKYIANFNELDKIFKIPVFRVKQGGKEILSKNFSYQHGINLPDLAAIGSFTCTSARSIINNEELISLQYMIQGGSEKINWSDWFLAARKLQMEFFLEFISEKVLNEWK